jgi:MoxR-like ATPase
MFKIVLDHLSEEEELRVVRETTGIQEPTFSHAVTGPDLVAFQRLVRRMTAPEPVLQYAVALARATRPSPNGNSPEFVKKWVAYGASVRAAQYLVLGAKARALTAGRYTPGFEDVRALAHPVLRHRILTNFHAESEGVTTGELVDQLLDLVPQPGSGM